MTIQLRVLGCFGVHVNGERVDVSPVPSRVLAYLALHPGPVKRSALAGVLWPQVHRARALGNLRSALWRLPPSTRHAVTESQSALRLADHVVSDLGPMLHGIAPMSTDVRDVLAWAWRDDLLAGWYDDWVLNARETLQLRRAVHLEELAATSLLAGATGNALVFATLAVAAQPLRESAHRALLGAHVARGHHRQAVEVYDELAWMLRHELGVGPSVETLALVSGHREEVA